MVLHTLLEYRVLSCLTDNEISPLCNNNKKGESCVVCVLQDLPAITCPLLTIGVLQFIYGLRFLSSFSFCGSTMGIG